MSIIRPAHTEVNNTVAALGEEAVEDITHLKEIAVTHPMEIVMEVIPG